MTKMQKLMQKMNCCKKKEAEKMVEVRLNLTVYSMETPGDTEIFTS